MTTYLSVRSRVLAGVVVPSFILGLIAAGFSVGMIGLFPPKLKSSELKAAAAATHVLVDVPDPSIVERRVLDQDVRTLVGRADLLSSVMASPPVVERIARLSRVPPAQLTAIARSTASMPLALSEPGSEKRANEILRSDAPYRLEVQARPTGPIIDIYSQAPTTVEAERLADNAVGGLNGYLRELADRQDFAQMELVRLRQLGSARGGMVSGGAPLGIGLLTFIVVFGLACVALMSVMRLRRHRAGGGAKLETELGLPTLRPQLAAERADVARDDPWPRTTRVLPWMFAAFLAMLWLVPFNAVELNASLPIDLKLDRLVLPVFVAAWVLALAVGGPAAPRLRLSWIHAALGAFVTCAFLSVVLAAPYLNQTLELDLSMKKLPLLVSYVLLFVVTASAVRRSEVRAFLKYMLLLAVICAFGIIWEYRFKQNLFYDLSAKLLPGSFIVEEGSADAIDSLGRRLVRGPTDVPLEAVTMLSMALPIALVGLMHAQRWRGRILHALAVCVIMAATFATYRKSALLAPVSVVLTLAYFRRRELLKLAPLAMVLLLLVSIVTPGAIHSTTEQFTRSDALTVPTVSDRASDYDAVRPDVWTNLAFGRGWGSYNHQSYRILDSEILHRTVEMGVVGLLAFLLIGVSVVLTARRTIASRDPTSAPLALTGAAAGVAFLVMSTLFDIMSFPHAPYVFLCIAGLVAVITAPRQERLEPSGTRSHAGAEHRVRRESAARRLRKHPADLARR